MGRTIIIDGKEYTERTVESLDINGQTSQTNVIDSSVLTNSITVQVDINTGEDINSLSNEDNNLEIFGNINDEKPVETIKNESILTRFIGFIRKIFA